jgi:Flp pilus assembly protein TadD
MRKTRNGMIALTLAVSTTISGGCASSGWFADKPDNKFDAAIAQAKSDGGSPVDDPDFWHKLSQPSQPGITDRISQAFSDAGDALTIEPTRVSATDATSLTSGMPELSPELLVAAGRVAEAQGQTEKALGNYQTAIKKDPKNLSAIRAMGRHYDRAGQFDKAITWYRKAITAHPEEPAAYNDLGLCLARNGKLDQSRQAFERAVAISPQNALYRNNLATVLVEKGELSAALSLLSEVSGESVANYNVGFLLSQRNRGPEAIPYLKNAIAADPDLAQAESLLATLSPESVVPAVSSPPSLSPNDRDTSVASVPMGYRRRSAPTFEVSDARPLTEVAKATVIHPEYQTTGISAQRSSYAKQLEVDQAVRMANVDPSTEKLPVPQVRKLPTAATPVVASADQRATVSFASRVLGLPSADTASDVMTGAAEEIRISSLPAAPNSEPKAESNNSAHLNTQGTQSSYANPSTDVKRIPTDEPLLRPLP